MKFRTKNTSDGIIYEGFTGFRDENDNEIFENDVVLYYSISGEDFVGIVGIDYENGVFELKSSPYRDTLANLTRVETTRRGYEIVKQSYAKDKSLLKILGNEIDSPGLFEKERERYNTRRIKDSGEYNAFVVRKLKEFNKLPWRKRVFNKFHIPSKSEFDFQNF